MQSESCFTASQLYRGICTPQNHTMSLRENTMDRPQASKPVATDNKPTHRLYPSLPNIDRYDICLLGHSTGEKPRTAAESHPDPVLGDRQSEVCAANSDVRMKAQILILEDQRHELLSINEKWAKEYRTMVQYYKEKVQDLKALLHFEQGTCEEEETQITLYKKQTFRTLKGEDSKWSGDADVQSELLKLEKEAQELRAQNSTLTRRGQHQHEEIKRLNKAMKEVLLTTQPLGVSSETLQDLWKHQAEIYKEDFLTERKDREKLKDKYLELENRFRKARSELHVLKSQVTRTQPPQPVLECVCTAHPHWEVQPVKQHRMQTQRRYTLDNKL
ncbi:TNFAIP3-interacting protein 1-like [Seriola dumerili]|uniref:TNFAIP3-interacting protein 1-like n=1 Tax=Seriola dumerili TaxID=41447 RepID=UPI000BBEB58D|nr:TNFAIP3-interacting protein 1-like [Seriola dumerili]